MVLNESYDAQAAYLLFNENEKKVLDTAIFYHKLDKFHPDHFLIRFLEDLFFSLNLNYDMKILVELPFFRYVIISKSYIYSVFLTLMTSSM